jgi:hypothetical protein
VSGLRDTVIAEELLLHDEDFPMDTFLGMEIKRERSKRLIRLSQQQHAERLAASYSMENVRPRGVPLSPGTALSSTDGDALTAEKASEYMSLVGSLLYLATCTRPEIAQSMGLLSKFMAGPTSAHWTAALGVMRYVSTTSGYGITHGGNSISIVCYCNAKYAGDVDTRRSTTGYLFMMGGGAVSWSSGKRQ